MSEDAHQIGPIAFKPCIMTVKQCREGIGLGQIEFACVIGVHPITVSKWERGVSRPNPYQAALIRELGWPTDKMSCAQFYQARGPIATLAVLLSLCRNENQPR
jgi:transcriptional regulator with XRE-family HTH domain